MYLSKRLANFKFCWSTQPVNSPSLVEPPCRKTTAGYPYPSLTLVVAKSSSETLTAFVM